MTADGDQQERESRDPGSRPPHNPPPSPGRWYDWLLVLWITGICGYVALLAVAFLPLHVGNVPMPVSVLLGVAAMWWGPRVCYGLTRSMVAALLPVALWFVVSVWLTLARNPLMPALPITVYQAQWRVMLLLGLGALTAAASVTLLWGDTVRDRLAEQRSAEAGAEPHTVSEVRAGGDT